MEPVGKDRLDLGVSANVLFSKLRNWTELALYGHAVSRKALLGDASCFTKIPICRSALEKRFCEYPSRTQPGARGGFPFPFIIVPVSPLEFSVTAPWVPALAHPSQKPTPTHLLGGKHLGSREWELSQCV